MLAYGRSVKTNITPNPEFPFTYSDNFFLQAALSGNIRKGLIKTLDRDLHASTCMFLFYFKGSVFAANAFPIWETGWLGTPRIDRT